jgi:hypothetical protein
MSNEKTHLCYHVIGAEHLDDALFAKFNGRFVSFLNALGTLENIGYFTWTAEFRWNILKDSSSPSGKRLEQYILFRLASTDGHRGGKSGIRQGLFEIDTILATIFADFGIEVDVLDADPSESRRRILIPFDVRAVTELFRHYDSKPFKIIKFSNSTPERLHTMLDLLFRTEAQTSLSVFCQPHPSTPNAHLDEFLAFNYEEEVERSHSNKSDDIGEQQFRTKIRLLSDDDRVSLFVKNAVFSNITGAARFRTFPIPDELMAEELEAIRNLQWTDHFPDTRGFNTPPSLKRLLPILSAAEVGRAIRFPTERMPGVRFRYFRRLAPAIELLPVDGTVIGTARSSRSHTPVEVRFATEDRRKHAYVVGKTGTGKSTFLLNMILQDIEAGRGLAVIDPHGELIDSILPHIPASRAGAVDLFDTTDREAPPGFNVIEGNKNTDARLKDYTISEITEFFIRLFGSDIFGPRIQDYFRNACITLMDTKEGGTIVDVPRLFLDDDFRKTVLAEVTDPVARAFWDNQMAKTGAREKQEMIPYFAAKFAPFVTSSALRPIVEQKKSTIDFRRALGEGRILLVKLTKGVIGAANMALLGTMIVSRLVWTTFERASIPENQRKDFFLYMDEFQNFIGSDVATILSEARKYRLSLVLAHQYLSQLGSLQQDGPRSVRHAIFGNVGSLFVFRVGREDAVVLAQELGIEQRMSQDIASLSNYNLYSSLLVRGEPLRAFSLETIAVPPGTGGVLPGELRGVAARRGRRR